MLTIKIIINIKLSAAIKKRLQWILVLIGTVTLVNTSNSQSNFNKLLDLSYYFQTSYLVTSIDSSIVITGQGNYYNSDSAWASNIYFAEISRWGDVISQTSFTDQSFLQYHIDNSNIQDVVVEDELISSFITRNFSVIYKILDSEYVFIDTLVNTFDLDRPIAVTSINRKNNGDIWISGVTFEDNVNGSFTYPFVYSLSEKQYRNIYQNSINNLRFGEFAFLDESLILVQYDSNSDIPLSESWGHELHITEYSPHDSIINFWKSDQLDHLGNVKDVYYTPENGLIISGIQFKQNGDSNFDLLKRIYTLKFSFESGVEWITYPFGEDWDNRTTNSVNELIPAVEGDGYIVAGNKFIIDTTSASFTKGVLAKIDFEGNVEWQKTYDAGLVGIHHISDIHPYLGGYAAVGFVSNILERPDSLPPIPTWLMYINSDGEFSPFTTIEETTEKLNIHPVVFPNPVKNLLQINGLKSHRVEIEIYDIFKKSFFSSKISNKQSIDVSYLNSGLYFLHIRNERNPIITIPFIKI